ncbi:hypothetical protein SUGI_0231410 [Cryptomeria japonica]|nr:hypothetical protein SUGI_0231410 [Cryptomeria japonica]
MNGSSFGWKEKGIGGNKDIGYGAPRLSVNVFYSTPIRWSRPNHSCRLGCVYEAILRFIQVRLRTISDDSVSVVLFDASAKVTVEMEDMQEGVVNRLLQYFPGRVTNYSSALDAAETLLIKGTRHHSVNVKKPVVIFLSDEGNYRGRDPYVV